MEKENIVFFAEENKNGEGKKENNWRRKIHILRRRKARKDKEENIFFLEKKESIGRTKIYFLRRKRKREKAKAEK